MQLPVHNWFFSTSKNLGSKLEQTRKTLGLQILGLERDLVNKPRTLKLTGCLLPGQFTWQNDTSCWVSREKKIFKTLLMLFSVNTGEFVVWGTLLPSHGWGKNLHWEGQHLVSPVNPQMEAGTMKMKSWKGNLRARLHTPKYRAPQRHRGARLLFHTWCYASADSRAKEIQSLWQSSIIGWMQYICLKF